jgi:hypothetical protein
MPRPANVSEIRVRDTSVTRIFRAFLWLRWRVLVNSLERTGARDMIERFSIATEKLGPIMALVLLVPSSLALAVLGLVAGYGTATGEWLLPMELVRYFLLASTAFTLIGPIILPMRDGGNAVRFLLLPIPRLALYMAHVTGALADPWVLLTVPPLVMIPIGLAAGGRLLTAGFACIAATALLLVIIGLTSLLSSAIHLLLRDRRRSDLVMLFLVVALPMLGLAPSIVTAQRASERITDKAAGRGPTPHTPSTVEVAARRAYGYLPSELYTKAATIGPGSRRTAVFALAGLAAIALAIQALAFGAFKRMLDMPQSLGARRAGAFGGLWARRIPGLTPGASAVALAHVRLAMRTPRGRSMLAAPLLMLLVFGFLIRRSGGMPFVGVSIDTGLSLATFVTFISVLSILPFAMNQFAIDKAGFTRQMLLPLSIGELLAGKAVGNALVAAVPAVCCFVLSAVLFPGGNPALWLALLIALAATYILVAPVAAALSAVFPRSVDLSSIGNGSNAHQAAGLLGLLSFVVSAAPSALLALVAAHLLHRPEFTPLLLAAWLLVAWIVSRLLFIPVRRLVASRCETLAQHY